MSRKLRKPLVRHSYRKSFLAREQTGFFQQTHAITRHTNHPTSMTIASSNSPGDELKQLLIVPVVQYRRTTDGDSRVSPSRTITAPFGGFSQTRSSNSRIGWELIRSLKPNFEQVPNNYAVDAASPCVGDSQFH
jgi:hypothetical protein